MPGPRRVYVWCQKPMKNPSSSIPFVRLASMIICLVATSFSEPDYRVELVSIPGGVFRMGSENGDVDERPVRDVSVDSFQMGKVEVTIGWYLRCMADGACSPPAWWTTGYFEETVSLPDNRSRMDLPVTGVSWNQANDFCRWLGKEFDLPSQAQWEYAAGGAKGLVYPWGNDPDGNPSRKKRHRLTPAATAPPASFGLFDMEGNAWEWTRDCYDAVRKGDSCSRRVAKGGSWSEHVWNLRVANKSFGLADQGYKGLGFRVVRNAK